jgi:hypothetical protein
LLSRSLRATSIDAMFTNQVPRASRTDTLPVVILLCRSKLVSVSGVHDKVWTRIYTRVFGMSVFLLIESTSESHLKTDLFAFIITATIRVIRKQLGSMYIHNLLHHNEVDIRSWVV